MIAKKINAIFFVNIIKKHNFAKQLGVLSSVRRDGRVVDCGGLENR